VIAERYQFKGLLATSRREIIGYINCIDRDTWHGIPLGDERIAVPSIDDGEVYYVDPATIEPVAVPVVVEPLYGYEDSKPSGYMMLCPNCDDEIDKDLQPEYCPGCGQRLLYPDEPESREEYDARMADNARKDDRE